MTKPRPQGDGAVVEPPHDPSRYIDASQYRDALGVAVDMCADLEDRMVAARLWELRRDVRAIREAIEEALPWPP